MLKKRLAQIALTLGIFPLASFAAGGTAETELLKGPCSSKEAQDSALWTKIRAAEKDGHWSQAVDLQKQSVREMCDNSSRWYELLKFTIRAKQTEQTSAVLRQMKARGFEILTLQAIWRDKAVATFLRSSEFTNSEAGKEAAALIRAASERKTQARKQLEKTSRPPNDYIAKGACPFECCTFREWNVISETTLFDRPLGTTVIGKALKAEKVKGVTGDVHLKPAPSLVVFDSQGLKAGEIIFILDNLGEGYANIWHRGEVKNVEMGGTGRYPPSASCWHEPIDDKPQSGDWWVQIQLKNGKTGWTKEAAHFGNMDACG